MAKPKAFAGWGHGPEPIGAAKLFKKSPFTPQETRILELLKDGSIHPKAELMEAAGTDKPSTFNCLLGRIRKVLRQHNQTIYCVNRGKRVPQSYVWVRNLNSGE